MRSAFYGPNKGFRRICEGLATLALAPLLVVPALAQDGLDAGNRQAQQTSVDVAAPDSPSRLSVSLGAALWHGDYGASTDTNIKSALLGIRYSIGGLRLSASLPYMRIKSDGTVFTGLGGTPLFVAPSIRTVNRRRDGLGDITLGASYLLPHGVEDKLDIEINGRVKLPTASSSSQLSTGKADYSVGVDLSRTWGRLTPSVSATYRIYGDTGAWRFKNGFATALGAVYAVTDLTALSLSYEYTAAASQFISSSHELVAGFSVPVAKRLRLTAYGSKGLSSGASDISAGTSVGLTF